MDKLSIHNEMACLDRKDRDFYDSLTDEERKKFSNYLMIRWGSSVQGTRDLQEFYLISTNENLNKHFFSINRHPKLQWLCASAVSPGMGSQRHNWIPPKKKDSDNSKIKKTLMNLMPTAKESDVNLLSQLTTQDEINQLMKLHGDQ